MPNLVNPPRRLCAARGSRLYATLPNDLTAVLQRPDVHGYIRGPGLLICPQSRSVFYDADNDHIESPVGVTPDDNVSNLSLSVLRALAARALCRVGFVVAADGDSALVQPADCQPRASNPVRVRAGTINLALTTLELAADARVRLTLYAGSSERSLAVSIQLPGGVFEAAARHVQLPPEFIKELAFRPETAAYSMLSPVLRPAAAVRDALRGRLQAECVRGGLT